MLNRPHALRTGVAAVVAGLIVGGGISTLAPHAAAAPAVSQGGWPVLTKAQTVQWKAGGQTFYTAPGKPTRTLQEFAAWFDKNIEPLALSGPNGEADEWSWGPARNVRGGSTVSKHSAGVSIDLNATRHPMGRSATFSESQRSKIRAKVASYGGDLIWGGDFRGANVDEMHFEMR